MGNIIMTKITEGSSIEDKAITEPSKKSGNDSQYESVEKVSAEQKTLSELDEKDKIIKEQKEKIESLTDDSTKKELHVIRFVAVEFNRKHYKSGEDEVNAYLEKGFKVIKDFQTPSGLVMVLGYKDRRFENGE